MMRIPSKPSLNYTFCLLIFVFLSFVGAARMHGPKGGPELASITSPNRVNGSQIGSLSTCKDGKLQERYCKGWVKNGSCKRTSQHYQFMNTNCKKSCNFCAANYWISPDKQNWHVALARCKEIGGNLASIHSNQESAHIKTLIDAANQDFWIGLIKRKGNFAWSDDSAFDYTDWTNGEPNGSGDCVHIWTDENKWDDTPCGRGLRYICRIKQGLKGCTFVFGDGTGKYAFERDIGAVSGPQDCITRCQKYNHQGQKPNGATVDARSRRRCYCEFRMTSIKQASRREYMTCKFASTPDVNECLSYTHSCDRANGICVDKIGGYTCKCKSGYVLQADKKTCKKVQVTVYLKICKDKDAKHRNCAGWKRAKFCQPGHNHFGFMKDNCPMTCGFCECKDKVNTCLHFRSKHYCIVGDRFYAYMKGNCKKTCGFCGNVRRPTRPPIIVPPAVVFPPANKLNSKLCGIKGPGRGRIVGGVETAVAEFPWIVGIVRKTNKQLVICGGTLLTNRWILTAAHCFSSRSSRRPENFLIRLGEHDLLKKEGHERIAEIDTIKVHENWDTSTYNNDIALLRLKNSVEFNRFHKPICMPFQDEKFRIGKTCIVAGWGRLGELLTTAKQLQKVELPLTQHKLCKDTFAVQEEIVTDQMICSGLKAGGKDSCEGDSGGPLICKIEGQEKYVQTGIVSWGVGCGRPGNFGVYARVSSFRNWVEKNIKN